MRDSVSLLWRAAATDRTEFSDIRLPPEDLVRLQRMVCDQNPNPLDFYPTAILQIASRGPTHNFVPIARDEMIDLGNGTTYRHHMFRFYFDGLIANMHRSMPSIAGVEHFLVGSDSKLVAQLQLNEDSFQLTNLSKAVIERFFEWPNDTLRIKRAGRRPLNKSGSVER